MKFATLNSLAFAALLSACTTYQPVASGVDHLSAVVPRQAPASWRNDCENDSFTGRMSCVVSSNPIIVTGSRTPTPYFINMMQTEDNQNLMLSIVTNSGYFNDMIQVRVDNNEVIDLVPNNQMIRNHDRGMMAIVPSEETRDLLLSQMTQGEKVMFRVYHQSNGVETLEIELRGFRGGWEQHVAM